MPFKTDFRNKFVSKHERGKAGKTQRWPASPNTSPFDAIQSPHPSVPFPTRSNRLLCTLTPTPTISSSAFDGSAACSSSLFFDAGSGIEVYLEKRLTAYPKSIVHCCSRDHLEKDDMDTVPSTNKNSWFPGSPRSYRICLSASRVKSAFTERGEKMSFTRNSFFQANSFSQDFFPTLFLWFSTLNKST